MSRRRNASVLKSSILATALVVATMASPAAAARPGRTMRVSVGPSGELATGGTSANPAISADGRFVAFTSSATNLVPGDTNGTTDVFVLDRATGQIERASRKPDGSQANGFSSEPSISGDGRFVTFLTSTKLTPTDTNSASDVYLLDRVENHLELASLGPNGLAQPSGGAQGDVSDDGRYVSFMSTSSTLVPGDDNATFDVFVRDRVTNAIELVSVATDGTSASDEAYWHDLSGDGRSVAWESAASDLVAGDTNTTTDVFVRDLEADKTYRASVSTTGVEGNADSFIGYAPVLSRDGRTVAFLSYASNLVPGDLHYFPDIFVRDIAAGRTQRVSVSSEGAEPDAYSMWPALSADGRYVGFMSYATNLAPEDQNGRQSPQAVFGKQDYFIHDRLSGTTELVSIGDDGRQATVGFINVVSGVAAGGRAVVFALEGALDAADTNGVYDVFVRDRGPELGVAWLSATAGEGAVAVEGRATFSGVGLVDLADPAGDSEIADVVSAAPLGADLLGFSVTYRPERGDLLLRWRPSELPGVQAPGGCCGGLTVGPGLAPGVTGAPAILYGWEMTRPDAKYEVRVGRAAAVAAPPAAPYFALYRCAPTCLEAMRLSGSFGGTGLEIRTAVPLSALGVQAGTSLSASRAFATLSEPGSSVRSGGDGITVPAAPVPLATLQLALAGTGELPTFGTPTPLNDGRFTATLTGSGEVVWGRACLGTACGESTWRI